MLPTRGVPVALSQASRVVLSGVERVEGVFTLGMG